MKVEVFGLFPTPVLKFNLGRDFSQEEINVISEHEDKLVQPPFDIFLGNNTTNSKRIMDNPLMLSLKQVAESCLNIWCKRIYSPLYGEDFRLKVTQSWLNYTRQGEEHQQHYHPNSIVSGVIYISANSENDMISFISEKKMSHYIQPSNFNEFNSVSTNICVDKGDIILFPSQLNHSVPKTTGNYKRVSLAFNSYFEGRLGISSDIPNYIEFNNIK